MRPLFPQQQTSLGSVGTSVWCQLRTLMAVSPSNFSIDSISPIPFRP